MAHSKDKEVFSDQLERWLKGKNNTTLASLIDAFEDKSFAIIFVLLMLLPALPVPTGGITHVLEVIVVIVALEMVVGLKTIWLPAWAGRFKLGDRVKGKTIPLLLKRVRWFEERSNPRGVAAFDSPITDRLVGLLVILCAIAAFVAPPFTGLDTLPSLGVVIMGLAIIFEDIRLLVTGGVVGLVGVTLVVVLGAALLEGVQHIL